MGPLELGFAGHTESSGDSRGASPSLPTSTVEVNSGDRTPWEISPRMTGQVLGSAGPPMTDRKGELIFGALLVSLTRAAVIHNRMLQ